MNLTVSAAKRDFSSVRLSLKFVPLKFVPPRLLRPSHRHALTFLKKNVRLKVYSIEKTDRIGTPAT